MLRAASNFEAVMSPVRYDPNLEAIGAQEAEQTAQLVEHIRSCGVAGFERHIHAMRAAHAKSHGILKGELTVAHDLPADLRQGVFQPGKRYGVVARISSSPADIHTDETPQPRGLAIKLIGVEGDRLETQIPGANQDFLMVNFPALPFGTIERYQKLVGVLHAVAASPEVMQRLAAEAASGVSNVLTAVGLQPGVLLQSLARDNSHPLGESYYTQGALRFGDYVGKLALKPKSDNLSAYVGFKLHDVEYSTLTEAVTQFFAREGADYELSVQLCADVGKMPIEDVSVVWDEALSPHRPLGTLRFGPQASYSPGRRVYGDDALSFSPWNGVKAHQPLGGVMRVRRAVYAASAAYRLEMNARKRTEPSSLQDVPD